MQVITVDKEPLVSVIMLTYNHEKYIRQALDSVLMQKVDFDYEILIGDDCSTDSTAQILLEYQQKYPDKICLRLRHKNIGATKNAYELLMIARGDYLATCEGDDYWTNINKLQIQIDFLKKNKSYIGCTHKFLIVDEQGRQLKKQKLNWIKQKNVFTFEDFEGIYLPGQPSTFVRRNLFKDTNEDFSILYKAHNNISDRTAMLLFLLRGNFYCMDTCMSKYRKRHGENITKKIYSKKDWYENDYWLNLELESYASAFLNRKVVFCERRAYLFIDILYGTLKTKNSDFLFLLPKLYKGHPSKLKFCVDLLKVVNRKLFNKLCNRYGT